MAQVDPSEASLQGADVSLVDRRATFGRKLRAAREAFGMTIPGLCQTTRITIAFLEVLEAGDFDKLPGVVFGRGFVRSIARATGQDPVAFVSEFELLYEKAGPTSVLKVEIKNKPNPNRSEHFKGTVLNVSSLMRRGLAGKLLVPLAAGFAIGYIVLTNPMVRTAIKHRLSVTSAASLAVPAKTLDLKPKEDLAQPEVVTAAVAPALNPASEEASTDSAAAPAAAVASASSDQTLELTVTESVRVRLDVDGGEAITKELAPDTYKFAFKNRADVMVYDAAALKISFNGRPLGSLGAKGRVRRLSFEATSPTPRDL